MHFLFIAIKKKVSHREKNILLKHLTLWGVYGIIIVVVEKITAERLVLKIMTVAELIEELEEYDKGAEVLIKVSNSMYVDSIRNVREDEVSAFFGKDFSSVILVGDEQIGAV